MQQIVNEGRRNPMAAQYGGLMYTWHGSPYLGGKPITLAHRTAVQMIAFCIDNHILYIALTPQACMRSLEVCY